LNCAPKRKVHHLTPGLTGWAQINGRDELPIPVKVQMDIEYMKKQSIFFDVKIIILTIFKVITSDNVAH
jgi:O-antigen biosynthesis protein WbqP